MVSTYPQKPGLSITQNVNKIKKSRTRFCRHWEVGIMCKISVNVLNSMVVEVRQSFQFFRQTIWFLEDIRALSKFKYWILHYLISIIKL